MRVGAVAGASSALQEGVLQATQETRTGEESAINIGASVVLGGLLGGGVSLLTRGQHDVAARALHGIVTSQPGSVGAASVERATVADMTVAGRGAERLASATQAISPNLRANFRESAAAREASQQLAENTLYQTMHGEGRSLGAAAETLARSTYNARMADAVKAHNAIYAEMKKAGTNMSRQDFEEATGNAMRNGDADANPFVARAASAWRERVFDPFKNEAVSLGLLPADVGVDTAASYLSRVWNREALTAREPEFKDIVTRFYGDRIASDYAESVDALKRRSAALDEELADLRLSPDERAAAMSEIEAGAARLNETNADQIDRVTRINRLRQQARDADKAGNRAAAREARAEAASVAAEGGDGLRTYLKQRGALRGRRRRVDMNYAGMADRTDTALNALADIEEANARSLTRLIARGRVFEREAQRLDPGKLANKLSDLRSAFYDVATRADKAADRAAKAIERMGPDADKAVAARLEKEAAAQRNRAERLNSLSARLETAEALDPDAAIAGLREAMEGAAREVSDTTLARGERAQRLFLEIKAPLALQNIADRDDGRTVEATTKQIVDRSKSQINKNRKGALIIFATGFRDGLHTEMERYTENVMKRVGRNRTSLSAIVTMTLTGASFEKLSDGTGQYHAEFWTGITLNPHFAGTNPFTGKERAIRSGAQTS